MQIAHITCNKTPYALPVGPHRGRNLRGFFGVKKNQDLWGECDKDDSLIPDDDSEIELKDGMRFYTANRQINQG